MEIPVLVSALGDKAEEAPQKRAAANPALTLVRGADDAPESPASIYLGKLTTEPSRRAMRRVLERAARLLGATLDTFRWELLRARHVRLVVQRMIESEKEYASATINTMLAALKGVAREAWLDEQMHVDDYLKISKVKQVAWKQRRRHHVLAYEELLALMNACDTDRKAAAGARDWAVITLLGGAGLRRSEAAALLFTDLERLPDAYALHVRGKGKNDRVAYLKDEGAREALDAWLALRDPADKHLLQRVDQEGAVLPSGITDQAVYNILRKRARQAGVEKFTPHDLRYTFGTTLIGETGDIHTVQQLLGHADISTTAVYDLRAEREKELTAGLIHFPARGPRPRKPRRRKRRRGRATKTPVEFSKKFMRRAATAWAEAGSD